MRRFHWDDFQRDSHQEIAYLLWCDFLPKHELCTEWSRQSDERKRESGEVARAIPFRTMKRRVCVCTYKNMCVNAHKQVKINILEARFNT